MIGSLLPTTLCGAFVAAACVTRYFYLVVQEQKKGLPKRSLVYLILWLISLWAQCRVLLFLV